jgi:hypothetical protein
MNVNFQTCQDLFDDHKQFGSGNSSQKFTSFMHDNEEEDDIFQDARGDEEYLHQIQSEMQRLDES